MQSINGMAERFRELLEGPRGIELPGCYDVLSAMILEGAALGRFASKRAVEPAFVAEESTRSRLLRALPAEPGQA